MYGRVCKILRYVRSCSTWIAWSTCGQTLRRASRAAHRKVCRPAQPRSDLLPQLARAGALHEPAHPARPARVRVVWRREGWLPHEGPRRRLPRAIDVRAPRPARCSSSCGRRPPPVPPSPVTGAHLPLTHAAHAPARRCLCCCVRRWRRPASSWHLTPRVGADVAGRPAP